MVDVQCRDIGLETVLISGRGKLGTLWRCQKPAIFSKCYTELVPVENDSSFRCAELVPCSPLRRFLTAFSPRVIRWEKTTRMRYGIRSGLHLIVLLNDQCCPPELLSTVLLGR